jgi:hypothetical protein
MNYNIKRLLGKHDPKLLRVQHQISWAAVQSMSQSGDFEIMKRHIKQNMSERLADVIPLHITETCLDDSLQLTARVYAFSPPELLALLEECYSLGSEDAKPTLDFRTSKNYVKQEN